MNCNYEPWSESCHAARTGCCRTVLFGSFVDIHDREWSSGKGSGLKKLVGAVFALCLLEALCFFFTGWWAYSVYLSSGATASQAFTVAEGSWTTGLFILIGGLLHWVVPRFRIPLAVAGVFGGFYSASLMIKSPTLLRSWNFLHGDIIAIGTWSEAILIVLAVACAAELVILAKGTT
jgi:hypothetical protein